MKSPLKGYQSIGALTHIDKHLHTYRQLGLSSWPNMHVCRLGGSCGGNTRRHSDNMSIIHTQPLCLEFVWSPWLASTIKHTTLGLYNSELPIFSYIYRCIFVVFFFFFDLSSTDVEVLQTEHTEYIVFFPASFSMSAAPRHLNPPAFSLSFLEAPSSPFFPCSHESHYLSLSILEPFSVSLSFSTIITK